MRTNLELLTDEISRYYADPLGYVMFIFPWDTETAIQHVRLPEKYKARFPGCEYGPDLWACEFLDDLGAEIRQRGFDGKTAVAPIKFATASGHGIGKSTMVAWLIKFVLDTRPMCKIVVTANTSEQLRTKTWAETAKWHSLSLSKSLFTLTTGRGAMSLYRNGPKDIQANWRCDATTCREENAEAFQGLHAATSSSVFIFDESSGIPDAIFSAREGAATDGEPMWFDFGNPTRKSGAFYEECVGDKAHRYNFRSIDSRSVSITNKNVFEEWRQDYGEDSDFFKVKVRGIFPTTGSTQFISQEAVTEAMFRPLVVNNKAPLIIGVDVARFGSNNTVIFPRIGDDARSFPYRQYNGLDITQVVEKVIDTIRSFVALGKSCKGLFIDGGGLGGGVVDLLRKLGYNPIDVNFGSKPSDGKYALRGDEMWGRMRSALDRLCLLNNSELKKQLTQREYGFTLAHNKIKLEAKDRMNTRGAESPDIADALALTFAADPADAADPRMAEWNSALQFAKHDYDPLEAVW